MLTIPHCNVTNLLMIIKLIHFELEKISFKLKKKHYYFWHTSEFNSYTHTYIIGNLEIMGMVYKLSLNIHQRIPHTHTHPHTVRSSLILLITSDSSKLLQKASKCQNHNPFKPFIKYDYLYFFELSMTLNFKEATSQIQNTIDINRNTIDLNMRNTTTVSYNGQL